MPKKRPKFLKTDNKSKADIESTPLVQKEPIPPSKELISVSNRLDLILPHVPYYSFYGVARLAEDVGVARSTISRLLRRQHLPSYQMAASITKAVSMRFGEQIDMRELFTPDDTYPTPSTCRLMGCPGCLPATAWCERTNRLKPTWRKARPGRWTECRPCPSKSRRGAAAPEGPETRATKKPEEWYRLQAIEPVHPSGQQATI